MKEFIISEAQTEKAVLVGLITPEQNEQKVKEYLDELAFLADTAGVEAVKRFYQKLDYPNSVTFVGSGKLQEIKEYVVENEIGLVIFDDELSAKQLRNIEKELQVKILDRTNLILDIFAARASTREGKLQVEMAQLKYRSQRLLGQGLVLSRLAGGIGTRGPGESKLEVNRRRIRERLTDLRRELDEMEKQRTLRRQSREKGGVPVVALVGYTNAGKSTLFNRLTGADVYVQDQLFATLDSVSRPVNLPHGTKALLVDTVGFIRKLPHEVVEAFHATLEEARLADVLVLVSDGADPQLLSRRHTVGEVLDSLGAVEAPRIDALNKCDLLSPSADVLPGALPISAATGQGLDELLTAIEDALDAGTEEVSLLVPFARYALTDKLRRLGSVLSQEHTAEGVVLRWRAEKANVDYALREGAVLLETERK